MIVPWAHLRTGNTIVIHGRDAQREWHSGQDIQPQRSSRTAACCESNCLAVPLGGFEPGIDEARSFTNGPFGAQRTHQLREDIPMHLFLIPLAEAAFDGSLVVSVSREQLSLCPLFRSERTA